MQGRIKLGIFNYGALVKAYLAIILFILLKPLLYESKIGMEEQIKNQETETKWVTKTLDVLLPVNGYGNYQDIFSYLAKVVDTCDPKYSYIIGLLNTCYNRGGCITNKQEKMAQDIISLFRKRGYFEESFNE